MYVVTGATGHTGSVVTEKLLAKGHQVRVLGRSAERLDRFKQMGAAPMVADETIAAALTAAFTGADAAYIMFPSDYSAPDVRAYQRQLSAALASALQKTGVRHAVVLSGYGANQPKGNGPVDGLHDLEQALNAIGLLNALYLRAGYFMENLLGQTAVIQSFGFLGGPLRADLALPMIATRDVGAFAGDALLKRDFEGKRTRELQGPRDVTYSEAAKVIGSAIGKPDLPYRQLPATQLKPAFMQMGISASTAEGILEMSDALNAGTMRMLEPRSPENSTPTTFETWVADTFVPAFRGRASAA